MNFKKTLFAAALISLPVAGFSLEAMDDETLSGVTGQDGITLNIASTGISSDMYIHDTDGFGALSFAGAIVIDNFSMTPAGNIDVVIDAGSSANTGSGNTTLNIAVTIPTGTVINTGDIAVANSQRDNAAWGIETASATIIDSVAITLGTTTLNIQLANEVQDVVTGGTASQMVALSTTITGGISLGATAINDVSVGGGSAGFAGMTILDAADNTDLDVIVGANIVAAGLLVELDTVGNGGMSIRITDAYLGTAGDTIGDIELVGLDVGGTSILVSGH